MDPIPVRAVSATEPPRRGSFMPLGKDPDRLSFLYARAMAKKVEKTHPEELRDFSLKARSVRVLGLHYKAKLLFF